MRQVTRTAGLLLVTLILLSYTATSLADVTIVQAVPTQIIINNYTNNPVVASYMTVQGQLIYADNGTAIPNAKVELEISTDGGSSWSIVNSTYTDSNGIFELYYIPTASGQLMFKVHCPPNTTSKLGEAYTSPTTVTVSKRNVNITASVPTEMYVNVLYSATFKFTDTQEPPFDYDGCFATNPSATAEDAEITELPPTSHSICKWSLYDVYRFNIEFHKVGEKNITVTMTSSAYNTIEKNYTIKVEKQTPKLDTVYVVSRTDTETDIKARFLEIDDDPAAGLPVVSIKINGQEVLSSPITTDSDGYIEFTAPSSIIGQGVPVEIVTSDTDIYNGATYDTTLDLRRPVLIGLSASITEAYEPATLTISVVDYVTGDYVPEGTVTVQTTDLSFTYKTSVNITSPGPIQITVPKEYIRADPSSDKELGITVTYTGTNNYQPGHIEKYFNVPPKPLVVVVTYQGKDPSTVNYTSGKTYTFDIKVKSKETGIGVQGIYVSASISYSTWRSEATGSDGSTTIKITMPSKPGNWTIDFVTSDPNYIYYGQNRTQVQVISTSTTVTEQGITYMNVNLWEDYNITVKELSDYTGLDVRLYSTNSNWTNETLVDSKKITEDSVIFTRMETSPGKYYYLAEVVDAYNKTLKTYKYVVTAKYKIDLINVKYPDTIYAGETFKLYYTLARWEGDWKPITGDHIHIYNPAIYHWRILWNNGEPYGIWATSGEQLISDTDITTTNMSVTIYANRYAGIYGAPPYNVVFQVPETDTHWSLNKVLTIPIQPLLPNFNLTVKANNTVTGDGFSKSYPIYSVVSDLITTAVGDPITISFTANTQPSSNIPFRMSLYVYYLEDGDTKSVLTTVATSGQPIKLKIYLPPGQYTDGQATPLGPVLLKFLGNDYMVPEVYLEFNNIRVDSTTSYSDVILTTLSNPSIYKYGYPPISFLGVVIGDDRTVLPNAEVDISLSKDTSTVLSDKTYTDQYGFFQYTLILDNVPEGKYKLEIKVPNHSEVKSTTIDIVVTEKGGLFIVASAPNYIFTNMTYAISVYVYQGDPEPVPGYQLDVWYSDIQYSDNTPITWNYLGRFPTDSGGTLTANIPDNATLLDPGQKIGWMYILALPADSGIDPNSNTLYKSQSSLGNLIQASKVYILASPQYLYLLNQQASANSNAIMGGEAETPVIMELVSLALLIILPGIIVVRGRKMRYTLLALALVTLVALAYTPTSVALQGGFVATSDYCIAPRIAGNSTEGITLDVTPIMEAVHQSPFVAGVIVQGQYNTTTVIVAGKGGSKTYQVSNGTITLAPRDLDYLTGLKTPLHIELKGVHNIKEICVDYYDMKVKVLDKGSPVPKALIKLIPDDNSHQPVLYNTNTLGDGELNFLPGKNYTLEVYKNGELYITKIQLTGENNNGKITIDLSKLTLEDNSGNYTLTKTTASTSQTVTQHSTSQSKEGTTKGKSSNLILLGAVLIIVAASVPIGYYYTKKGKKK